MDLLQPLQLDQWPFLRDIFKQNWPVYAQYYYWMNNAIKWKTNKLELPLQLYCPNGKYDSGVFVGIFAESKYIVIASSIEESKELLGKALIETSVIDWTQTILFSAVHQYIKETVLNSINEIVKYRKDKLVSADVTNYYFKPKEECAKLTIDVPTDYKIKELELSNIPLVHSLWPHRSRDHPELSTKFLEAFVKYNRGLGLFSKKDNSLVSWVLHTDWGGLGMLQTVDEHKRKGYGKIVVEAMTKTLAEEENLDSILFIVDGNIASEKLFSSLNYKKMTTATWIEVEPISK